MFRLNRQLVQASNNQVRLNSSSSGSQSKRGPLASAAVVAAMAAFGATSFAMTSSDVLHAPNYNFAHKGPLTAYDHASIRRGFQVYQQICASCHSLHRVSYRTLLNVAFSEDEMKVLLENANDVEDGPNDKGQNFMRPAKLSDYMPSPFKNEEEGRMANDGAYPPDLSLISKARGGGADYLFALLTGYRDAPEGVNLRKGLHYNPYFPGGAIAMAQQLFDGSVDYEDGTPATTSQMAHDVSVFLTWAAEPEHDDRKLMGLKWCLAFATMTVTVMWYKRFRWSTIKGRALSYKD